MLNDDECLWRSVCPGDIETNLPKMPLEIVVVLDTSLLLLRLFLLQLAGLVRRDLLVLLHVDLVAERIIDILLRTRLLVNAGAGTLTLDPVMARGLEVTIAHRPDFRAERLGEVTVVGDDEDTSLELLESANEGGERLAIEVIC
jgi:hypothetical protein